MSVPTSEVFRLAVLDCQAGRLAAAAGLCRQILVVDPVHADSLHMLGVIAYQEGHHGRAVVTIRRAIAIGAYVMPYHANLGAALLGSGHPAAAGFSYRRALVLRPNVAEVQDNLGAILQQSGRTAEAIACFQRSLNLAPASPDVHGKLGLALKDQESLGAANGCFRRAIVLRPAFTEMHNNLGSAHMAEGALDDAVTCFRRALALQPDFVDVHWNCALALLLNGDYAHGWTEYTWRWQRDPQKLWGRRFDEPLWSGEPADGRTILLWSEQGLGDCILAVRYVGALRQRGWQVLLEVPRRLTRLFGSIEGITVCATGDAVTWFDVQCPLMSLPQAFGTEVETIPAPVPYLAADAERVAHWQTRLPEAGLRVGIAWQGKPTAEVEKGRSVPLACFAPLARVAGVQLISLQREHGLDQLQHLPEGMMVHTLGPDFDAGPDAFVDTAAVMMSLDLIITVDTAVGHLAGALGRPVWLVLKTVPYWLWMLERRDTPWYPHTDLYRQSKNGDWSPVFARMTADLENRLEARR